MIILLFDLKYFVVHSLLPVAFVLFSFRLKLQSVNLYQLYIDLLDGQCLLAYVTRVCTMISLFHAFPRAAGLCDFALTLQAFRRFRFTEVVGQTFLQ